MRLMRACVVGAVLACGIVTAYAAGTALSVSFFAPQVTCDVGGGAVSAPYTIATVAADGATVVETLRSGLDTVVATNQYTVAAGNVSTGGGWTFAGRTKTRDGVFSTTGLVNGTYELEVCVTQAGSGGNANKTACSVETILVNCGNILPTACNSAPFGEVTGNTHIGSNAAAEIQFRGDFGDTATVRIVGNGFDEQTSVDQNGNSCTYHLNWKFTNGNGANIQGNNGPGTYTVYVTGSPASPLSFNVTLVN